MDVAGASRSLYAVSRLLGAATLVALLAAGLRLDTSSVGDRGGSSGVRWRPPIGQRRGFGVRHPVGL